MSSGHRSKLAFTPVLCHSNLCNDIVSSVTVFAAV